MLLENLIVNPGVELDPALLEGVPGFKVRRKEDWNPLSQRFKIRYLEVPNRQMRTIHAWVIDALSRIVIPMPYATGYQPGNSPRKNIERHKDNTFLWLLDLKDAYRHVNIGKLAEVLCGVYPPLTGHIAETKAFLGRYCMSSFGGLPMGAPASPALFNLYCAIVLDVPIGALCGEEGLTYTRYGDDLTFSAKKTISRRIRRVEIPAIITGAGFLINHRKVELHDLTQSPARISGIRLRAGGRISAHPAHIRRAFELLDEGLKGDLSLQSRINGAVSIVEYLSRGRKPTQTEVVLFRLHRKFRHLVAMSKQSSQAPLL